MVPVACPAVEKTVDGRPAWSATQNEYSHTSRYVYFDVEHAFRFDTDEPVELTVSHLDAGRAEFRAEYDSNDPRPEGGRQQFRPSASQPITGTGHRKEARFVRPHARFAARRDGADFRLAAADEGLAIGSACLRLMDACGKSPAR